VASRGRAQDVDGPYGASLNLNAAVEGGATRASSLGWQVNPTFNCLPERNMILREDFLSADDLHPGEFAADEGGQDYQGR
jgi:hypothetical protein